MTLSRMRTPSYLMLTSFLLSHACSDELLAPLTAGERPGRRFFCSAVVSVYLLTIVRFSEEI